ncbi:MAG TPA: Rieske (2Fe-2S) protein [Saprospiraceae bacterium]|nr:Rieske (2Fe-2S) protein [Saprospiraceae bacterium]
MDRKEFLSLLGLSVGGMVVGSCFGGCSKDSVAPRTDIDFTLDLSDSANAALQTNGGFLIRNSVVVARTLSGDFIAVAAACTHQGTLVQYQANNGRFFCPNHGSNFTESGTVINGPATQPLQQFKIQLSGNILRVFS